MSMPVELFHNSKTIVVTCVMVFTAHRPHPTGKKTWFGYWRDDGYVKTKHKGRDDINQTWGVIKKRWVDSYRSREVINGISVLHEVGAHDEWCARAYLETDYTKINPQLLMATAKRFVLKNAMLIHKCRNEHVE